jgi:hypothetical protein
MEVGKSLRFEDAKSISFGDPLPLNLQVSDGRDDLEVYANIIAPSGAGLARVRLSHFQNGFYVSTSFPMPESPHVFAQYVIEKNGRPLEEYEIVTETFYGKAPVEQIKWIVGWVVDETIAEGFIVGHEDAQA